MGFERFIRGFCFSLVQWSSAILTIAQTPYSFFVLWSSEVLSQYIMPFLGGLKSCGSVKTSNTRLVPIEFFSLSSSAILTFQSLRGHNSNPLYSEPEGLNSPLSQEEIEHLRT